MLAKEISQETVSPNNLRKTMTRLIGVMVINQKNQRKKETKVMPGTDNLPPAPEPTPEELDKREEAIQKLNQLQEELERRLAERDSSQKEDVFEGALGEEECCGGDCGCSETELPDESNTVAIECPLNWDALNDNSVLVIKIDSSNPMRFAQFQHALVTSLLQPRKELLKQKKISVVFMGTKDDISVLQESEMNRLGWYKKEKSLIITPDEIRR